MKLIKIDLIIDMLIKYWKKQNIAITPVSYSDIIALGKRKGLCLPKDFVKLYSQVNGMRDFYPNEIDEEGFLFYPIESIISVNDEFSDSILDEKSKIFIFAEYMHRSWYYGYNLYKDGSYRIGIIPEKNTFKVIADSLGQFIELYLEDSEVLYNYS